MISIKFAILSILLIQESFSLSPYMPKSKAEAEALVGRNARGACPRAEVSHCSKVGKSSRAAEAFCDSFCCEMGYTIGYCDWKNGDIRIGYSSGSQYPVISTSQLRTNSERLDASRMCTCSNNFTDLRCGLDGSFLGIRCPFDTSACKRKCCRRDPYNYVDGAGRCGGFLSFKCKC